MFVKVNELLAAGKPVKIVAYGDSISTVRTDSTPPYYGGASCIEMNWARQLGKLLSQAYPAGEFIVDNFGIGGQNAYEGLGRYKWLEPYKPDLVLLAFGTNDGAWHPIPPECTAHAIRTLVKGIGNDYKADVVVMAPVGGSPFTPAMPYLDKTIDALRQVAQETSAPFVDVRAAMMQACEGGTTWANFHCSLEDCHPSDQGHAVWAQAVMKVLQQNIAG
jgi:lysophospholipase L1-like esterase